MSCQPYIPQTRSQIGNSQTNRINSADIRSSNQKKYSSLISNTLNQIDKKQTIILSQNLSHKITQQPSQSTLYQQSTMASTSVQQQSNSGQSQQLPFSYPQMSQILSGSQISQSSFSRNSQSKQTYGQFTQKSQFLLNSKRKESDEVSENSQQNTQQDSQQFFKNQMKDAHISKDESVQLDNYKVSPFVDGISCHKPLTQANSEYYKIYYLRPAPSLRQSKNSEIPPENFGDQQVSVEQESAMTMTTIQQSFMIDSAKIRERSIESINVDYKRTRLMKRLLDLQEPRNILEEEDEDIITTCQTERKLASLERSQSQQYQQNQESNQKYKKYSCEIKQIFPNELEIDLEAEAKDENIEEFSPHQKPPSMASLNNHQLNRDWNNQKSHKDRRISAATLSVDYRSAQLSTNETIQSYHYNIKPASISLHQPNEIAKKMLTQTETQNQNEEQIYNRKRRSSSPKQADDIPDEPEKTQILRTFYLAGNRMPIVKLSQINKQTQQNHEKYFIPPLMKSLKGEKDKLSNLYRQYFQKMYFNLSINPKLENKFHQMSPVFLPPLKSNKKTIFFDLDETLIHCIDIFTDPQQYQEFNQSNMTNKDNSPFSKNSESCNEVLCTIQCTPQEQIQCLFSIRPYAIQILKELSKDFELILLTAARKIYADAVLQKLDPENKIFSHRFYRECCIEFQMPNPLQNQGSKKSYLKDLRIFQNRKLENVILVDNSPLSYLNQVSNGIPILDYCNNNRNDEELLHLCSYLKTLLNVTDVRESIKQKFFLKQYRAFENIENLQDYILQEYSGSSLIDS